MSIHCPLSECCLLKVSLENPHKRGLALHGPDIHSAANGQLQWNDILY